MFRRRNVCVRSGILSAVVAALLFLFPAETAAQAVVDAQRVEFTPSADHSASTGGIVHVTNYVL